MSIERRFDLAKRILDHKTPDGFGSVYGWLIRTFSEQKMHEMAVLEFCQKIPEKDSPESLLIWQAIKNDPRTVLRNLVRQSDLYYQNDSRTLVGQRGILCLIFISPFQRVFRAVGGLFRR